MPSGAFRTAFDLFTMLHLLEQTPEQLEAWLMSGPCPVTGLLRCGGGCSRNGAGFDQMTDLPKPLREQFAAEFQIWTTRVAAHPRSADGTEKLLLELADGKRIECVLLRDDKRAPHDLHQHASRLRDGLRLLRQRH